MRSERRLVARRAWVSALCWIVGLAVAVLAPQLANTAEEPSNAIDAIRISDVPIPEPANLSEFVVNRQAAIQLGKALFWDMQVGSDGVQACATCHAEAGSDHRTGNAVSPGLLDQTAGAQPPVFNVGQDPPNPPRSHPNGTVIAADYPFYLPTIPDQKVDGDNPFQREHNDVTSSQGVRSTLFQRIVKGNPVDEGTPLPDDVFNVGDPTDDRARRVEPRNTPTMIDAIRNTAQFWDGRANFYFNGVNPFGPASADARILVNTGGNVSLVAIDLPFSSLASQAVGPPLSDFEMSWALRTFAKLGKKMLSLTPLGLQYVAPTDSVLGPIARSTTAGAVGTRGKPSGGGKPPGAGGINGLAVSYSDLIKQAFAGKLWNSNKTVVIIPGTADTHSPTAEDPRTFVLDNGTVTIKSGRPTGENEFTQMEANFSFFWGMAIQLYEATLVSDDTEFDKAVRGEATLDAAEQRGKEIFQGVGKCENCHGGPEFTNASVRNTLHLSDNNDHRVELMTMGDGNLAFYDNGFYNISQTRTLADIGRGGRHPFANPIPLAWSDLAVVKATNPGSLPARLLPFIPELPGELEGNRTATRGAHKTPGLRNIALTGPYFHNGSARTLRQVVQFYVRGGNYPDANINDLDPDIGVIRTSHPDGPILSSDDQNALVAFLLTLTDDDVRWERSPFDHPELWLPLDGLAATLAEVKQPGRGQHLPAVGAEGRTQAQGPLRPFLWDDSDSELDYHTQE